MTVAGRCLALAALPLLLGLQSAPPQAGTFALQSGVVKANAFLRADAAASGALRRRLDLWLTRPGDAMPITRYDVDLTKLLHLIVVSDDLQHFDHIHPVLGRDGHFRLVERFPAASRYYLFADTVPTGVGQQVFRFTLALGRSHRRPAFVPRGRVARAGPYTVALGATQVRAGEEARLTVQVRRGARRASDLHPYLGALAHVVLIGERDLSYVHVHPEPLGAAASMHDMMMPGSAMHMDIPPIPDSAAVPPDMQVHLALRERGRYRLWFQFRGGSTVFAVPFVLEAT